MDELKRAMMAVEHSVAVRDKTIAVAAAAGQSNERIAKMTGLSKRWVSEIISRQGVKRGRGRPRAVSNGA